MVFVRNNNDLGFVVRVVAIYNILHKRYHEL